MTLSSETTVDRYTAAEAQTVFAYTFRIDDGDHIDVYVDDALQASGYTVSNVGNANGGNVTFTTAPRATGEDAVTVTLIRNVPNTQLSDLPTQGAVDTATIEAELDRFAMRLQQVEEKLGRALLLAASSTTSDLVLPELEAAKTLTTNAGGTAYVLADLADPGTLTVTSFAETLLDDTTAAAMRSTLGGIPLITDIQDGVQNYVADGGAANAYTLTLSPAVLAYAAGQIFWFLATNANTGASTLNVSGLGAKAVQIRGSALAGGEIGASDIVVVVYDGTQFQMVSNTPTGWTLIESQSISASSSLDFETGINSTYDLFKLALSDVRVATDAGSLWLRVSDDAGATYEAGATDYEYGYHLIISSGGGYGEAASAGAAQIVMAHNLGNGADEAISGEIFFSEPDSAVTFLKCWWRLVYMSSAGTPAATYIAGGAVHNGGTDDINGIRIMAASGNLTSGTIALYGLRK